MGLNLGNKKTKKQPGKTSSKKIEDGDEIVTAETEVEEEPLQKPSCPKEVQRVNAYQQGLVNKAFDGAVNSYWKKSAETSILMTAMSSELAVSGAFFGTLFLKTSFARKTGGSALL